MKYVCVTVPELVYDYLKGESESLAVSGVASTGAEAKKLAQKAKENLKNVEKFLGKSLGRKVILIELDEVSLDDE